MTNEERIKASIDQIYTYDGSRYTEWRMAAVKSIEKILLNLDEFYADILPEIETKDEMQDIVHCQIRNGWFYEAVSQAEQAIEDLFSTMMNLGDMAYFTKDVIRYSAAKVKNYIWDFKSDDLEYICEQMGMPYFPLDEPWEHEEIFEEYKKAVLLVQKYVVELQAFHRKYYEDYCQYKHGLSVALAPMQNPLMKDDVKRREAVMEKPLEGSLQTFHQGTIGQYEKRNRNLPAIGLHLKPGTQRHLHELHSEGNLLFFTVHPVDMETVIRITKHACILLNALWRSIIWRCEENENDEFHRVAFPTENLHCIYEIGFPKHE